MSSPLSWNAPPWAAKYIKDVEQHGPLPQGIRLVPDKVKSSFHYEIGVGEKLMSFSRHPLSPEGRTEWREVLAYAGEEKGCKADFPGVAHPPIVYKPSEWQWWRGDNNMMNLLISALQISGVEVEQKDFQNKNNQNAVKKMESDSLDLYHPCDRQRLAVYQDEHMASCWARHFGRGLVIVSPEFRKDRKNFTAHASPKPQDRPAVRARYSTGIQEEFPPIVLGCLPINDKTNIWFLMVPVDATKNVFDSLWKGCNWDQQASRFGYGDTEQFIWAAVSIQRSIVLGAFPNQDSHLGNVLWQYGQYLAEENGHGSKKFFYDPNDGHSSSPTLTFHELTRWILTSGPQSNAKRHANDWDTAILQRVAHRKTLNLGHWGKFMEAATAMQLKK